MMKKKISLPIVIAALLIAAAVAFSAAYIISTSSMNAKLRDVSQKQALFTTLSKVDEYVREKYEGDIDEQKLSEELCKAYAEAFGGRVVYLTAEEYKDSVYAENYTDYTVLVLADSSAVVVLGESQMTECLPTESTSPSVSSEE